ncbi:hypothetical protein CRH11_00040 [Bacillus velezensis]|uniref:hypothetical protein n=1 Tax=Bacillus velezensis TaxID=492670 RepID=UPI000C059354|nr:hypothetical protein [Bacillus velezensis]ATO08495.1 hypothetical protein CRH11_00040 [Bacillus velezensis]
MFRRVNIYLGGFLKWSIFPIVQNLRRKRNEPERSQTGHKLTHPNQYKENHMQANLKMYIGTLEKICLFLDVPVEKVIKIVKE